MAQKMVDEILDLLAKTLKNVRIDKGGEDIQSSRVAKVAAGQVYITGGSDQDVKLGSVLTVYSDKDSVKDPETGEVLGSSKVAKAKLKVVRVEDKFSICSVLSGAGVRVNDMVER